MNDEHAIGKSKERPKSFEKTVRNNPNRFRDVHAHCTAYHYPKQGFLIEIEPWGVALGFSIMGWVGAAENRRCWLW